MAPSDQNASGVALILAMLIAGLLAALGISLLVMTDVERRIAANAAWSGEALAAAHAAVDRAMVDLRAAPDWTPLLSGSQTATFTDGATTVNLPIGGTIDLAAVTAELQAGTPAAGANTPTWRLFGWGPLNRMASGGSIESLQYLAVWIADDVADGDGTPLADRNGILTLRGEARGPGGTRRAVEATVARTAVGTVKMISVRDVL